MKTSARSTLRTIATGTLAAAFLAAGAAAASAHVHAVADDTGANAYTHVTFSVPNESATAKTSKLVVKLPTDPPFTSVSVQQQEGWTAKVISTTLSQPVTVGGSEVTKAATSVEWTADAAHQIGPNQYQTFSLSLGKLPATGTTVMLPAAQTYTDGSVVNWNEKTVDGGAEPEHPAPFFVTTAAVGNATPVSPMSMVQPDNNAASAWGMGLGAAGLLLGGTALGMSLAARRKAASAK